MGRKRIASVMLAALMFISLAVPASAAAAMTTDEKIEILGQLSVLKTNNPEAQAKRFEAVVFIVRMMGKEEHVKFNADAYKYTDFSDVDSEQWYAPYIGYCHAQGVLSGEQSDKFSPESNVSEKMFLKMVLLLMGYTYNSDFNMTDIYKKAYDIGIVTDTAYKTRAADNTKYKKSDIANVLYNALGKEKKGTKVKLIQNLIYENIITKEEAVSMGIISDKTATAIAQITSVSGSKVVISLNEPVENVSDESIRIYETSNHSNTISFTLQQTGGSILELDTEPQIPYVSYTVELANLVDEEGNMTPLLTGAFEGYKNSQVNSDFFKISRVEAVSKNAINVFFTHPVNINAENASCYKITEESSEFVSGSPSTMSVKVLTSHDNAVTLYLKDKSLTQDASYILNIDGGLISGYGVRMNDGQGDSIKFKGVDTEPSQGYQEDELKLLDIILLNNRTLQLEFNMELNAILAKQIFNYVITNPSGGQISLKNVSLTKDGKMAIVSLNGTFDKAKEYGLTINYLTDITREYTLAEFKNSFTADYPDDIALAIDDVTAVDGNTLLVYFNKPLNETSAQNPLNYTIMSNMGKVSYSAVPVKALYSPLGDPYAVKLFISPNNPMSTDKDYKIRVSGTLQDYSGNIASKSPEYTFTCGDGTVSRPAIMEAVTVSSDAIKVVFNKEIAYEAPNILTTNYMLQYTDENGVTMLKLPTGMNIINETTFILKFDYLDSDIKYRLGFNSLKDYSGALAAPGSDVQGYTDVVMGK